jgi:hypothetical protein
VWEKILDEGRGASIKAASYFPESQSGSIVLWNARYDALDHSVDVLFEGDIFDALDDGKSAASGSWDGVIWAGNAHKVTSVSVNTESTSDWETVTSDPVLTTSVAPESYETLTVAPYHSVGKAKVAALGLVDKYAGLAGIQSSKVQDNSLVTEAKFDGLLAFIVAGATDVKASIDGNAVEVTTESPAEGLTLVQVDLTKAPAAAGKSSWTVAITV